MTTSASRANALRAIPTKGSEPMTCNQIQKAQEPPRMGRGALRAMLESLTSTGLVEVVLSHPFKYYRWASRRVVASSAVAEYTKSRRYELSLPGEDDPLLRKLFPLSTGNTVRIWLELPPLAKKSVGNRRRLVILVPGESIGLPVKCVLVSILGSGSCVVRADLPTKLADLVLAGMPAQLAGVLMNKIHRVLEIS